MGKNKATITICVSEITKYLLAIIMLVFTVFPFLWIISCSLKDSTEILATPPKFIPMNISFENYINAIQKNNLLGYLANSLIITIGSMILTIIVASLAAYVLGFMKFKGKRYFSGMMVTVQMLPGIVSLVPLFLIIKSMGLMNTRIALILVYSASTWGIPVAIILISGFFSEIPRAIHEAARIDGCTSLRIFYKMIIPLALPGIITTAIYNFIMIWQEFLLAVSFLQDKKLYTLPVGLTDFVGLRGTDWGGLMATSVVIAIPSIILFVSIQNFFINNLAGSVKG